MNEFVLVEFLFRFEENEQGLNHLKNLGDEFVQIKAELDWHSEDAPGYTTTYNVVSGKISSQAATAVKLSDKFLSDRMRISYIPDELKNKYRNR